jgi:hypothetical protein
MRWSASPVANASSLCLFNILVLTLDMEKANNGCGVIEFPVGVAHKDMRKARVD